MAFNFQHRRSDKRKRGMHPGLTAWLDFVQDLWRVRFIRFLLVGVLNTIFGYVVFASLVLLGVHYAIAAFVATILGILFNFKTTGTLVFLNRDNKRIVRFFLVYLSTYFITVGLYRCAVLLGISVLVAAAILAFPMALYSYTLNRKLVFNQHP